jgi:hypothetical protein
MNILNTKVEFIDVDKEISKPIKYTREMFGIDMWIPVDKLKVDIRVQRELQDTHVDKLQKKFDPAAFGRISVSPREDGYYYVQDGQHRVALAKAVGLTEVPCIVQSLESLRDEGRAFIKINENSAKITGVDKYRIGVASEVVEYLRIKECVDYAGLRIGTGVNAINCVSCIYRAINQATLLSSIEANMRSMKKTLYILNKCYGVEGINHLTVQGMFLFAKTYLETGHTDVETCINRFNNINIKDLIARAYDMKNNGKGKTISYVAYLFLVEYNKKLKPTNKLPMHIEV